MVPRHERYNQDVVPPEDLTYNMSVLEQAERVLDEAAQNAQKIPTYDYVRGVERKSDRNRNIVIAVVMLIAVAALILGSVAYSNGVRNATQLSVNQTALQTYNEAIQELRAKGVPEDQLPPPPATPQGSTDVDVNGLVDAASAKVLANIKGNPAYVGPQGDQGPGGPPGAPCDPATNPACIGPEGAEGTPGTPGTPGTNGNDGAMGATGGEGPKGDQGDAGRGIVGSEQDPNDPCTRIVRYSDGSSEAWNTCPPSALNPDGN